MKKIMFNDRYGLTDAVLQGRKTMTRRLIKLFEHNDKYLDTAYDWDLKEKDIINWRAQYKVGEVVAVAQAYKDIAGNVYFASQCAANEESVIGKKYEKGWDNKMFVAAYYMPHQIRITDIKVERLQDISEEDCIKEGILASFTGYSYEYKGKHGFGYYGFSHIKEAFASLIDKVSGKGIWETNPWVFAYSFELVK